MEFPLRSDVGCPDASELAVQPVVGAKESLGS
jgi:hypothetical protein